MLSQPIGDDPPTSRMGGGGPMYEFDACSDVADYRRAQAASKPLTTSARVIPLPVGLCRRHPARVRPSWREAVDCETCLRAWFGKAA